MIEPTALRTLIDHSADALVLRLDRDGTVRHASAAVTQTLGSQLEPGRSLLDGGLVLTHDQRVALFETDGAMSCKTTLLRGEAPPIGLSLVAVPDGDELLVLLTVEVGDLIRLQEELGSINSQLTNLNRERVKAKQRLERTLAELEQKNEELNALNEELQVLNEELEAQTEALQQAHDQTTHLERENQHLHQLDELKNQFIGIISHELKTPLNFVMGFSSVLADEVFGPLNVKQAEAVDKVLHGAERLDALISELLDANRLQAGRLSVSVESVALPTLVDAVLEDMRPAYATKEVGLAGPATCPPTVTADPMRLHQVLRNLLSNAVKFTPAGGRVHVTATPIEGPRGPMVRVTVADTGIGIPDDALGHLFTPFYQVDSTSTRRYGGTGLGLSIVRSLIELMHGEVGVESREGEGSTFWFTLPT